MARGRRPIGIDLFAGAGGLSLGFDVAAAGDIDPVHCAVHKYNFPLCATLCRNVADLEVAAFRSIRHIRCASQV